MTSKFYDNYFSVGKILLGLSDLRVSLFSTLDESFNNRERLCMQIS